MPGSNPLFGLNTLGGALSLQTKDGYTDPGTSLQVTTGSDGRAQVELESGGANAQGLAWYGTANVFRDSGWRDDSPSRLGQVFGKLGWRSGATQATLTASAAIDRSARQRPAGTASCSPTREPASTPRPTRPTTGRPAEPGAVARLSRCADRLRQRLSPTHRHAHVQWRHQRGLARPAVYHPRRAADRGALAGAGIAASAAAVDPATDALPPLALHRPGPAGGRTWAWRATGCSTAATAGRDTAACRRRRRGTPGAGATTHQLVAGRIVRSPAGRRFAQTAQLGFLNPDRSVDRCRRLLRARLAGFDDGPPTASVRLGARTTDRERLRRSDTVRSPATCTSRSRRATTAPRSQPRRLCAARPIRPRSTAITCSRASTRRSA